MTSHNPFKHCLDKNIKLIPQWIPREENKIADYLSKVNDTDNWSIDDVSFCKLDKLYGPFTFDRFADNINKKLDHFNSKFYCPETSAVDAFSISWKG